VAVRIGVIVGAVAVVARTPDLKPGILAVMALGVWLHCIIAEQAIDVDVLLVVLTACIQ